MKNKCKTCGRHELEHPIYSEKPCEKFTPEDEFDYSKAMDKKMRELENHLEAIQGKQTDKLYNTEYTSKGCGKHCYVEEGVYFCGGLSGRLCPECLKSEGLNGSKNLFEMLPSDTFCLKDEIDKKIKYMQSLMGGYVPSKATKITQTAEDIKLDFKEFIKIILEDIDNPEHEINCSFGMIERIIKNRAGDL